MNVYVIRFRACIDIKCTIYSSCKSFRILMRNFEVFATYKIYQSNLQNNLSLNQSMIVLRILKIFHLGRMETTQRSNNAQSGACMP